MQAVDSVMDTLLLLLLLLVAGGWHIVYDHTCNTYLQQHRCVD